MSAGRIKLSVTCRNNEGVLVTMDCSGKTEACPRMYGTVPKGVRGQTFLKRRAGLFTIMGG